MHANACSHTSGSRPRTPPLPILLYDGSCGLCARSVQFILQHESASRALQFATLEGPTGESARRARPDLAGVDSVFWVEPATDSGVPRVLVRSDAVLAVMTHLGGPWRVLARIGRFIPRVSRDALYRIVARYRYNVFGRDQSCLLPTPEQRARFLD
ncbi:MAG: DCC1-like thiol-disulfide oxidoreductase family protein [Gemmatimonadota bacterium]